MFKRFSRWFVWGCLGVTAVLPLSLQAAQGAAEAEAETLTRLAEAYSSPTEPASDPLAVMLSAAKFDPSILADPASINALRRLLSCKTPQWQNEFELHARAILGLPVDTTLKTPGASAVIYGGVDAEGVVFDGLEAALAVPRTDLRLFGKPESFVTRRMGVALAYDPDVETARRHAAEAAYLHEARIQAAAGQAAPPAPLGAPAGLEPRASLLTCPSRPASVLHAGLPLDTLRARLSQWIEACAEPQQGDVERVFAVLCACVDARALVKVSGALQWLDALVRGASDAWHAAHLTIRTSVHAYVAQTCQGTLL